MASLHANLRLHINPILSQFISDEFLQYAGLTPAWRGVGVSLLLRRGGGSGGGASTSRQMVGETCKQRRMSDFRHSEPMGCDPRSRGGGGKDNDDGGSGGGIVKAPLPPSHSTGFISTSFKAKKSEEL